MREKGFTLAEVLVAIAIIAVVGAIMVAIFVNTLRGSSKSQALSVIKQNGQALLETMDKTIRNSNDVVCISSSNLIVEGDAIYTRYRFIAPSPTANGLIQKDNPVKQIISGTEETDEQFVDRICLEDDKMPDAVILTDTNPQTGVSVKESAFTKASSAGFNDQVTITFKLGPAVKSAQAADQMDPVTFQTTITLR